MAEGGPNLHALGLLDAAKAPSSKDDPKDIFELLTSLGDRFMALIDKLNPTIKIKNLGEVGLNGVVDPTKGAIATSNPINAGAAAFSPKGDVPAQLAGKLLNFSELFPKTSLPEAHPLTYNSGVEISPAQLFVDIHPSAGPSMGRGGMEIG